MTARDALGEEPALAHLLRREGYPNLAEVGKQNRPLLFRLPPPRLCSSYRFDGRVTSGRFIAPGTPPDASATAWSHLYMSGSMYAADKLTSFASAQRRLRAMTSTSPWRYSLNRGPGPEATPGDTHGA